jgi:hypothetical protein
MLPLPMNVFYNRLFSPIEAQELELQSLARLTQVSPEVVAAHKAKLWGWGDWPAQNN